MTAEATFTLSMNFDPGSMRMLHQLEDFDPWLAAHMAVAMRDSIEELKKASQDTMLATFENPTGAAESKWRRTISPFRSILTNTSKYGQRLNYGFSGLTDSLGRYFAAWPNAAPGGYHWAETAVEMATPTVYDIFYREVRAAVDEVI